MKIWFLKQSGQMVGDKFKKLSKKVFLWNVLQLICCNFTEKHKNFAFS